MAQVQARPRPVLHPEYCKACGRCIEACAHEAIAPGREVHLESGAVPALLDLEACNGCGLCVDACPEPYGLVSADDAAWLREAAARREGTASHIPSYGPESRGGTSYADVRVAEREVLSPEVPHPHALVAFNAPSLARFGPAVEPGGVVLYDASVVRDAPPLDPAVKAFPVPCTDIARALGQPLAKNVVALGALQAATGLLPEESLLSAMRRALAGKRAAIPVNEEAFRRGVAAVRSGGRVSPP